MSRLSEREAQVLEVTEKDREEVNENNPIIFAETAPNRFQTLTYFFPEEDGVEIIQDLDHQEEDVKVYYFDESVRVELTKGALYEWALEKWESD